jgi:hypothetical protein
MAYILTKATTIAALAGLSLTCACSNVSYVSNNGLRNNIQATLLDEDAVKNAQKFGAVRFASAMDENGNVQERLFIINRTGKSYMAETLLSDHTGDAKAYYDKAFFAFGTNREDRSLGFRLRFVY